MSVKTPIWSWGNRGPKTGGAGAALMLMQSRPRSETSRFPTFLVFIVILLCSYACFATELIKLGVGISSSFAVTTASMSGGDIKCLSRSGLVRGSTQPGRASGDQPSKHVDPADAAPRAGRLPKHRSAFRSPQQAGRRL